ncbi:MAG: lipopolysaccharide biosynthesis protein [Bacteroidota bacterium]
MLRKLFSHTVLYGTAPQVIKIANFLALPIITKNLTSTDYGIAGVVTAYTASIAVLATLGLRVVLVNSFYKSPNQFKWLWRQIYGFLILWNWIYALLASLLIYIVIPSEAIENKWTILFLNVGPLVFFGPVKVLCSTYYQIKEIPSQIAIRSLVFGLTTVTLNIYFISFLKMGYMGWFWSSFIVGMLTNASYFYPLNFVLKLKPIFNYKWRLLKNSLKVSLPTIPHYYSTYLLNSSDRLVMDVLSISTKEIGRYNVAYIVSGVMGSLSQASGQAIGPLLNKLYKEGNDEVAKHLIVILQIVFFCVSVCSCLWMKEIFQLLIKNDELATMYPLGIIIFMAFNYRPMYFGANSKLLYTEKTNLLWQVTLVAGLLNVGLNFIFIPIFGFEVAAYTTFIGLMYMGYAGFFYKTFKKITSARYNPVLWLFLTIVLTITVYMLVELNVVIKIILTCLVMLTGGFYIFKLNKLMDELRKEKRAN